MQFFFNFSMEVVMGVQKVEKGYRIKAVSELFGVHRNTIWRWVREGVFPPPARNNNIIIWFESDLVKKQAEMRDGD